MSSVTTDMEIKSYIAAVEQHLGDIGPEERRDLLDDLEQHLLEVTAESDGSLVDRVGPPDAYAAELRVSAGLQLRDVTLRARLIDRVRRSLVGRAFDSSVVRDVREFLPQLRPGWWVLRGYLAVLAMDAVFFRYDGGAVPSFDGNEFYGLVVIAGFIVASVWLGRRSEQASARKFAILANIAIVAATVVAVGGADVPSYELGLEYAQTVMPELHHEDGTPISNICAYDSKLRPQGRVLLYDQNGRPIDNLAAPEWGGETIPGAELERSLGNAYPRPQRIVDPETGETTNFECPTFDDKAPPKRR